MFLTELIAGLKHHALWKKMAWIDVKQRYRRSWIGPFWLTIGMGVTVSALALLYANLFKIDLKEFLPFIASGFVFWALISTTIVESANVFLVSSGFIKQIKLPFLIYIYRLIYRNTIIFLHNVIVLIIVLLCCLDHFSWSMLWAIPGFFAIIINLVWVCLLCAILCTRYRDFTQIIVNIIQIFFFITPINWMPNLLNGHRYLMTYNPFYYFLEIVRAPLIQSTGSLFQLWEVVLGITVVGYIFTGLLFRRCQKRLVFWL